MNHDEILKNIDELYKMPVEEFQESLNLALKAAPILDGETLEDYNYSFQDDLVDFSRVFAESLTGVNQTLESSFTSSLPTSSYIKTTSLYYSDEDNSYNKAA